MKALLFTHAYPPMRYPRSIQISRLVKYLGCEVDVVCCNELDVRPDASLPDRFERNPGKIFRIDHRPPASLLLRRLLNVCAIPDALLGWSLAAAKAVATTAAAGGYDVLVTFGQPMSNHLAGLRLKRRLGIPWVAHFSDPWADNPFHRKNFLRRWANRYLEGLVVKAADTVVFTSEQTRQLVMGKYPPVQQCKAAVLPHAFDPEMYPARVERSAQLVVRHLGNFYPPRSPAVLLEALALVQQRTPSLLQDVRIEFIGEISSRIRLDRLLAPLPEGLVAFLPSVDYVESLRLMAESSLLVVIDAPFDTSVFLPSKLIDYLGAKVPILAVSPSGTTADLVSEYGGVVAAAVDASDVANKLAGLLVDLRECGDGRLNAACRERFRAVRVAECFEKIVAGAVARCRE
ncbi:MAG: hypothetical protein H6R13_3296 [Proteobacteria bacterium]|nr:hypothetical protein [Pseudomonadota bacterium]